MLTLTSDSHAQVHSYAIARDSAVREIRSHVRFSPNEPQMFTLLQRHFVAGGQHLILDESPQIAVFPGLLEFELVGWNIRLPYDRKDEIGRQLVRKFLDLYAKAARVALNEQEEAQWVEISKRVDYRRFSLDRTVAVYAEGTFLDGNGISCRVKWHDGTIEKLTGALANVMSVLEPGEHFTALAKFGEGNALVEVRNVTPAPAVTGDEGERMWREWPVRRS